MTKQVFSLNTALAGIAAVTSFGYVTKRAIDATAEIERNAEMAGVAIKAYQELAYASEQYDISQDALTDGLKELNLRADEFIATAGGSAAEAFERLGYSQKDLNARLKDAPALLEDIIRRMEGLDRAAQIRIADELFGGQGGEQFVRMIRAGANELNNMRKRAHELGIVIDADIVRESVKAKQQVDALSKVLQVNFQKTIVQLAPLISDVATGISRWTENNQKLLTQDITEWAERTARNLNKVASAAANAWFYMRDVGENLAAFSHSREELLSRASKYVHSGLLDLNQVLTATDQRLAEILAKLDKTTRITASGDVRYKIGPDTPGYSPSQPVQPLVDLSQSITPLSQLPQMPSLPGAFGSGSATDWLMLNLPGDAADQAHQEIQALLDRRNQLFEDKNNEMIDLSQHTAELMQENFSGFFYDAMKGEMDSFSDYMEGIFDSILRSWSDLMGKMLAESIFSESGGSFFKDLGSWAAGLFSGSGGSSGGSYVPGAWGAKGLVYDRDGVKWHAAGDILSAPTIMPLRNGSWVGGGESGTEAIMPLQRMSNGRLGVASDGGGGLHLHPGAVVLNIQAIDAKSGSEFVRAHSRDVVDSIVDEMKHSAGLSRFIRNS